MISIIIPFYNEAGNLEKLIHELLLEMDKLARPFEIVFVNDGSTDASRDEIMRHEQYGKHIHLQSHRRRMGKGIALGTGIEHSHGSIIMFMDADLQNDPNDISKLLIKIDEGYDFVNGVRDSRDDHELIKLYSSMANSFARMAMKSPFTDVNCAFKAMKREVLNDIVFYGNNFRFLPLAVYFNGYKVTEVKIHNRPRFAGVSKFGVMKVFTGLLDTFTAYFLYRYSEHPLLFFGGIGGSAFGLGFVIAAYLSVERIFYYELLYRRPMLQFAILLMIVGIQIIMTGFIGELIVYLSKRKK